MDENKIAIKGNYQEVRSVFFVFRDLIRGKKINWRGKLSVEDTSFFQNRIVYNDNWSESEVLKVYNSLISFSEELKIYDILVNRISYPIEGKDPKQKTETVNHVGYNGENFIISFKFNHSLVQKIKAIPDRKYDESTKTWEIPFSRAEEVKKFADENNFKIGDRAQQMIFGIKENLEQSYSAERVELNLPMRKEMYDFQTVGVDFGIRVKRVLIADQMGLGKLQSVNSKILTPDGWKRFGDIIIGDKIIGKNGKVTEVTGVFPQGKKDLYRVYFSDGFYLDCGLEHLWKVIRPGGEEFVFSTEQLMDKNGVFEHFGKGKNSCKKYKIKTSYKGSNGNNRYKIPIVEPVNYNFIKLPIDPYTLGVWLGDGSSNLKSFYLTINKNDIDILDFIEYEWSKYTDRNNCFTVKLNQLHSKSLIDLGLLKKRSWEKFVPNIFLISSIEDRLSLLQGLMDTDGYARDKSTEYSTTSLNLCNSVVELVQSLGGIARVKKKQKQYSYKGEKKTGRISYSVNIKLPQRFELFRCKRKKESFQKVTKYFPERYITDIKFVGKEESMCISVSAPDRLYVTDHFIVTHNTIQGMGVALGVNKWPILVICPKSLRLNWSKEWDVWTDKKVMVGTDKMMIYLGRYIENDMAHVVICNYDSLEKHFVDKIEVTEDKNGKKRTKVTLNKNALYFKGVIIDEAHECRNEKTKRYKVVRELLKELETKVLLTGTPIVNSPNDLASLLELLGHIDEFGGRFKFNKRYSGLTKGKFGNKLGQSSNLQELNIKLRSTCMIRREKHQVLSLPEKIRTTHEIELSNRADYDHAFLSLQDYLAKIGTSQEKINQAMRAEIIVKMNKLKYLSAMGKIQEFVEFAERMFLSDEKLVVFCWHKDIIKELRKYFSNLLEVSGEIKDDQVEMNKNLFMNDPKYNLIVLTYGRGSVGHTLTASSNYCALELSWTDAIQSQSEDRIHRIGQKNTSYCHYFMGKDTIDQYLYEIIERKMNISKQATGSSEEIEVIQSQLLEMFMKQVEVA